MVPPLVFLKHNFCFVPRYPTYSYIMIIFPFTALHILIFNCLSFAFCFFVFSGYIYEQRRYAWDLRGQKSEADTLELEFVSSCELPCGCCELTLSPFQEQYMLLTTELFFQPLEYIYNCFFKAFDYPNIWIM